MPVYNAGSFLRPALLSIVNQSYSDWELILLDDGSTDGCFDGVMDVLTDRRIRLVRDGFNRGIAVRLNQIIDMATGCYLARMDADDISYPQRFEEQLFMFESDNTLDLVAARAQKINAKGEVLGELPFRLSHDEICSKPFKGFYLAHPTWMGKIEWFKKYRYAVPAPYLCEDQDLLLRAYTESKFGAVDKILFGYRVRSEVDFSKLFKTRLAFFRCQFNCFLRSKSYMCLTKAGFVFCARVVKDLQSKLCNLIA
jgi:glycosyltransferase involved in cell wall biosynthesis